jgi:hypothetical protein
MTTIYALGADPGRALDGIRGVALHLPTPAAPAPKLRSDPSSNEIPPLSV